MGHNVGDAAANAVKRSEKKAAKELTPEEQIKSIRNALKSDLPGPAYIPTYQIATLLGAFDAEQEFSHKLAAESLILKDAVIALESEKKTMTDTIFGLTQKVQELQAVEDKVRTDICMLGLAPFVHTPTDLGVDSTLDIKS